MKIVMQCAGTKNDGGYWQNKEGKPVSFVAHPEANSSKIDGLYAFPDDISDADATWRELVRDYNKHPNRNPFDLYPAYRLYKNPVYGALVEKFGLDGVYILSAGWGLIRSDFLTPHYDITFQAQAALLQRRKKKDKYNDFCMLPKDTEDMIVYLGGKDYIPLFCDLTKDVKCRKVILHNMNSLSHREGYSLQKYITDIRTNWHYTCAHELIAGSYRIDEYGS